MRKKASLVDWLIRLAVGGSILSAGGAALALAAGYPDALTRPLVLIFMGCTILALAADVRRVRKERDERKWRERR